MSERPIIDRMGHPLNGQSAKLEIDPIHGVLFPCYFSLIPVMAPGRSPECAADDAMAYALAACAKIGINISDKSKEQVQ